MSNGVRKAGLALCGFGRAGQIHFHGIRSNHRCELKYVVDLTEGNEEVKKKIELKLREYMMDGVKLVSADSFEQVVLADTSIDAVIVATPTDQHEYYIRASLKAKKAVFSEKPVAADLKDVIECYDLAENVKKPLFCAFNRRFDQGMSNLQHRVRDGQIGTVYQIKTTSRDSPLPSMAYLRISNGIFHDCAVHDIDMICWVLGEAPVSIFAQGSAFHPEIKAMGDLDSVTIVLKFPSGVIGTIDLSRHSRYGYDQRLEVLGSKGMLQVENIPKTSVVESGKEGISTPMLQFSFPQRYKEAYLLEMDTFLDIVLDPTKPCPISRESVLLSTRIADACGVSFKEGRVVNLDSM